PWIRMRLRSILRKRCGGRGRGRGADHQRWRNAFFAEQGLFSLVAAMRRPVNPPGGEPPTGEPCAVDPLARFGGGSGRVTGCSYPYRITMNKCIILLVLVLFFITASVSFAQVPVMHGLRLSPETKTLFNKKSSSTGFGSMSLWGKSRKPSPSDDSDKKSGKEEPNTKSLYGKPDKSSPDQKSDEKSSQTKSERKSSWGKSKEQSPRRGMKMVPGSGSSANKEEDIFSKQKAQSGKDLENPCPKSERLAKQQAKKDVRDFLKKTPWATWDTFLHKFRQQYSTCPAFIKRTYREAARDILQPKQKVMFAR
ncbi:MAG: hypothetical protein ACLQMS_06920, partial [Desulfomonilaceae bacterium]